MDIKRVGWFIEETSDMKMIIVDYIKIIASTNAEIVYVVVVARSMLPFDRTLLCSTI